MRDEVGAKPWISGSTLQELANEAIEGHPSTPELIATVLREAIVSGVLLGGVQLRQSELAGTFGVSIIPVREALRQLVAEGFITFQRNRGGIVAETSTEEIKELFDLRVSLESMLLAAAVPQITPRDIEKADSYQLAFEEEDHINRWGRLNWQFHEALYLPANRPRTLKIVSNINRHIDRLIRLQMSLVGGKPKSRREHRAILAACGRGDVKKAVSLLQKHIRGVEKIILNFASKQTTPR